MSLPNGPIRDNPRRVRLGMIGGGPGSNIGAAHRYAARFDGRFRLLAGVFSSDPKRSREFAATLDIDRDRRYDTWQELVLGEAGREDGVEVVSIMTPNNSHFAIARALLEHGFDVMCDKPMTTSLDDALELRRMAHATGLVFGVTYNYSGYPMVRHARSMVESGLLGEIRLVQVEHASGWASDLLEAQGHKQAIWRTDPAIAGKSTVVGDLGTHAHHLVRFVTGLEVAELSAELSTIVPGRRSDDNGHIKLRLDNGARGLMWVSMVAVGHEQGQRLRVYGETGSIDWAQEHPNHLIHRPKEGPAQILSRGAPGLSPQAMDASRLWPGHPEGFLAAFANVYNDMADTVISRRSGGAWDSVSPMLPTVVDGVLGVKFVEAAVESDREDGAWVDATVGLG